MREKLPPKTLIVELGLHANGIRAYAANFILRLAKVWRGWPRIAIKTQHWVSDDSIWCQAVTRQHGRAPLVALPLEAHAALKKLCSQYGFLYGVTAHDTNALGLLVDEVQPHFIKMGHRGWDDRFLVEGVLSQPLPFVATVAATGHDDDIALLVEREAVVTSKGGVALVGGAHYPSPIRFKSAWGFAGYSCHLPADHVCAGVEQAIQRGAEYVEVHASDRAFNVLPRPGDMPVCLTFKELRKVIRMLGNYWYAD